MLDIKRQEIVRDYIHAKDENRPHLLKKVFTETAFLEMVVKPSTLSFPRETVGRQAIGDVLVRQFCQRFENVYTYCVIGSIRKKDTELVCRWLVGMNEKVSGAYLVGCGWYEWHFDIGEAGLADRLSITIEEMVSLRADFSDTISSWLASLPYPWCDAHALQDSMPELKELISIRNFFKPVPRTKAAAL